MVGLVTIAFFIFGLSRAAIVSKGGPSSPDISATVLIGSAVLCFSAPLFLYSILLGLQAAIVIFTTEFAITNRRVVAKTGFIRRHTLEMLLPKIESVSVNQNVLGRLLNFGTVTVTGTGGIRESFRGIIEPVGVRKNINQIIEGFMQSQQKLFNPQAGG